MEWTELIKFIQEKEDPRLEFKESPFLKDSDDIAVQLVSFANRHGGRILVGVRDDGTIEGAKIDHDRRSLDILNIANNKCSPILEVSFDHSSSTEGDVLIVNVQKKRVIPHAIVDRKGAEIYKRTYYIRSEKGKRLVDDTILRSLFENTIDPNMSLTSSISLWYNRKGLVFSQIYSPTYMWYILPFVQDMSQPDREYILSNEIENIQSLLLELLPYAFLNHLKMTFISSWLIDKKKTKGISTIRPVRMDLPSEIISSSDIIAPGSPMLSKLSLNTKEILSLSGAQFMVPKNTEISVGINCANRVDQSSLALLNPLFSIKILFSPQMWGAGLLPTIKTMIVKESADVQDIFASCTFGLNFDAKFAFPDSRDDLFEEHHTFAKAIRNMVVDEWNWDREVEKIQVDRISHIDYNVAKIRQDLEDIKSNIERRKEVL